MFVLALVLETIPHPGGAFEAADSALSIAAFIVMSGAI